MRDGAVIGSAPVRINRPIGGGMAYVLRASDETGRHWLRVNFTGPGEGTDLRPGEGQHLDAPSGFRSLVGDILSPGSTIIVTPDSLGSGSPGAPIMVIENEDS
jgi:hypothetical protein